MLHALLDGVWAVREATELWPLWRGRVQPLPFKEAGACCFPTLLPEGSWRGRQALGLFDMRRDFGAEPERIAEHRMMASSVPFLGGLYEWRDEEFSVWKPASYILQ